MVADPKVMARSPLHYWHCAHGARMTAAENWETPAVYTDVAQEIAAARAGLALADISSWAKISVLGAGVADVTRSLLGEAGANKSASLMLPSAHGSRPFVNGPVLACRLTEEHLLLLASGPCLELRLPDFAVRVSALEFEAQYPAGKLFVDNKTSTFAGFSLVGNHIEALLRHLTALDVSARALPRGTCAQTSLAGVHALLVPSPELQVPSMRIYASGDLGEYLWEELVETGQAWNLTLLGLDGWNSLRKSDQ